MELEGRRAIITGAGSGIGRATALRLGGEGALVAVIDIDEALASETVAGIQRVGGTGLAIRADVTARSAIEAMVEQVRAAWGGIDILMNNAGGSLHSPFLDLE